MDPFEELLRHGGVARWSDLAGTSVTARQLDRLVQAGEVVRVTPGVYARAGVDATLVSACVHRSHVTCVTAAALHGFTVLTVPPVPHLSVPRSRGRTPSRVRRAWPAVLHREDGSELSKDARGPLAAVADALARMLTCVDADAALVTIDSALAARRVTVDQIRACVRGPRQVRALIALRQADGRSQSPTETLARLALTRAGLPTEPAVRIPGVGWVDLLVAGRIVVELDGFAYHSGRAEYREDRRRDRELVRQGYIVLRFTYEDVIRDPQTVVRAVLATLAGADSRASGE